MRATSCVSLVAAGTVRRFRRVLCNRVAVHAISARCRVGAFRSLCCVPCLLSTPPRSSLSLVGRKCAVCPRLPISGGTLTRRKLRGSHDSGATVGNRPLRSGFRFAAAFVFFSPFREGALTSQFSLPPAVDTRFVSAVFSWRPDYRWSCLKCKCGRTLPRLFSGQACASSFTIATARAAFVVLSPVLGL